jgi:hypothetical protein
MARILLVRASVYFHRLDISAASCVPRSMQILTQEMLRVSICQNLQVVDLIVTKYSSISESGPVKLVMVNMFKSQDL